MMHSALTYELLNDQGVLDHLSRDQWITLRRIITELILSTDMMRHFELVDIFKKKYANRFLPLSDFDDKLALYRMCIKCADIAHAGKVEALHEKWSMKVVEEFFHQGDLELDQGLPVSMFCDRQTANLPTSQSGFISNVVKPLFLAVNSVVRSSTIETVIIAQLDANVQFWKRKVQKKKRASVAPSYVPIQPQEEEIPRRENSFGRAGVRMATEENL